MPACAGERCNVRVKSAKDMQCCCLSAQVLIDQAEQGVAYWTIHAGVLLR